MALFKEVVQSDGVPTNYHRILFVQITTNRQNSIAVLSYVNELSRENEKEAPLQPPYQRSVTYETDYDPDMTTGKAYAFLKTLPRFEGATDI